MLGVERGRGIFKESYQSQESEYLTANKICESQGFSIGTSAQLYTRPRSVHSDAVDPFLVVGWL